MPEAGDTLLAAAAVAVFFLAGVVKGAVGLGLPTVALGLLGIFMPPAQAAALLVVPSLVTNVWQAAAGPHFGAIVRRVWPMFAGICAGAWLGFLLVPRTDSEIPAIALGIALFAYAALGLSNVHWRPPVRGARGVAGGVGVATGVITAATGVFAIPSAPYLQALGFTKDALVQALGISFTVSTIALAAVLAGDGLLLPALGLLSLLCLGATVLGMVAGRYARRFLDEDAFRRLFYVSLLLLGLYIAARGLLRGLGA